MRNHSFVMVIFLISVLFMSSIFIFSKTAKAAEMWSQTYGGTDNEDATSLVQTSDGGYALAGYTGIVAGGEMDFWLVKVDGSGNIEWNQTYGETGEDRVYSLVQTSDGGYALAGFTNSFGAGEYDFWLVKTDEYGVIPEFPSWIILPLFLAATLFASVQKEAFPSTIIRTVNGYLTNLRIDYYSREVRWIKKL